MDEALKRMNDATSLQESKEWAQRAIAEANLHTKKAVREMEARVARKVEETRRGRKEPILEPVRFDGYLNSVRINLAPATWVEICGPESELLPACCANVSRMRDILFDALRQSRMCPASQMEEFYQLATTHDGWMEDDLEDAPQGDPIARIIREWEVLRKDESVETKAVESKGDLSDCLFRIHKGTLDVWWEDIATGPRSHKAFYVARLIPAMKRALQLMSDWEPVEAWGAFVGDEPLETRAGPALFEDKKVIDENLEAWQSQMGEGEKIEVRKVLLHAGGIETIEGDPR